MEGQTPQLTKNGNGSTEGLLKVGGQGHNGLLVLSVRLLKLDSQIG